MITKPERAVQIENLTVKFGDITAIKNVFLDVYEHDFLGIIGPNGGGKTTLLKAIIGLLEPTGGKIRVFGEKPEKIGGLVGYVPQITALSKKFPATVKEVVLMGRLPGAFKPFHKYTEEDHRIADSLMERAGIGKLAGRMIGELSGGEFQKMLIARALAIEPRLLILDEPTASVDTDSRNHIYDLLNDINRSVTVILVTHDLLAVSSHVKTLACLNRELVCHGGPELSDEAVKTLYGCPVDLIAHGVPHRVLREHGEDEK